MRNTHPLTVITVCSLIAAGLSFTPPTHADELPAIPVTPTQTKVLLLPTLDETGDRAEMQREHVSVGNHRLEYELLTRGFQVIGPHDALRAARAEGIDLDDTDSRGSMSLKMLAKDTGADWVVSAAVIEVKDDRNRGFSVFANRRAYAKVQIKVYDAKQGGYLANRFQTEHKTTVRAMPGINGIGTTGLFKQAIDTTIQRSIANLLTPYPKNVKVADEFGESDLIDKDDTKPADNKEAEKAAADTKPQAAAPAAPAAPADAPAATPAADTGAAPAVILQ